MGTGGLHIEVTMKTWRLISDRLRVLWRSHHFWGCNWPQKNGYPGQEVVVEISVLGLFFGLFMLPEAEQNNLLSFTQARTSSLHYSMQK